MKKWLTGATLGAVMLVGLLLWGGGAGVEQAAAVPPPPGGGGTHATATLEHLDYTLMMPSSLGDPDDPPPNEWIYESSVFAECTYSGAPAQATSRFCHNNDEFHRVTSQVEYIYNLNTGSSTQQSDLLTSLTFIPRYHTNGGDDPTADPWWPTIDFHTDIFFQSATDMPLPITPWVTDYPCLTNSTAPNTYTSIGGCEFLRNQNGHDVFAVRNMYYCHNCYATGKNNAYLELQVEEYSDDNWISAVDMGYTNHGVACNPYGLYDVLGSLGNCRMETGWIRYAEFTVEDDAHNDANTWRVRLVITDDMEDTDNIIVTSDVHTFSE